MVRILGRDWSGRLNALLREAQQSIILCSPFITVSGVNLVSNALSSSSYNNKVSTSIITNLSLPAVMQGATDPIAVHNLTKLSTVNRVFHVPGLHAKVYISDDHHAIITSGNLTAGGLKRNFEYGIELDDPTIITDIRKDILAYAKLGAIMTGGTLTTLVDLTHRVKQASQDKMASATSSACLAFAQAVTETENHLLRQRVAGQAIHTIFMHTVEYILKQSGPLPTTEIHNRIADIHPDLCDDTIDRVIDGIHFGKKWKHAVRTAQQMLKRHHKVTLHNGRWTIIAPDQ